MNDEKLTVCTYAYVRGKEDEANFSRFAEKYDEMLRSDPGVDYKGIFADYKKEFEWGQVMDLVLAGEVKKLIVSSFNDVGRNIKTQLDAVEKIVSAGTLIYFDKEKFDTNDVDRLKTYQLAYEAVLRKNERNKELCAMGRIEHDKEGYDHYILPLGFDQENGKLVINKKEKELVTKIFDMYLEGYGYNKIALYLEKKGYKTKTGKTTWTTAGVGYILRNERYAEEMDDARFKPFVTREKFDAVQAMISKKNLKCGHHKPPEKNIFSGKIKCGRCGKSYTIRCFKKPTCKSESREWMCLTKKKYGKAKCKAKNIRDDYFRELLGKAFCEYYHKRLSDEKMWLLDAEILELNKTKENFDEMLHKDLVSQEQYDEKIPDINEKLQEAMQKFNDAGFNIPGITKIKKSVVFKDYMADFLISAIIELDTIHFCFDGDIVINRRFNNQKYYIGETNGTGNAD